MLLITSVSEILLVDNMLHTCTTYIMRDNSMDHWSIIDGILVMPVWCFFFSVRMSCPLLASKCSLIRQLSGIYMVKIDGCHLIIGSLPES